MENVKTFQLGDRLTLAELDRLGLKRGFGDMAHLWGESRKDGTYARAVRTDDTGEPEDVAYNNAIRDSIGAIRALPLDDGLDSQKRGLNGR